MTGAPLAPSATVGPRRRQLALRLARAAAAVAGVAVVALLVRSLGPSRIAEQIGRVRGGFLWMLGAYLAANVAYAAPLGLVLPRPLRPSPLGLLASRLAAVAVNASTPFLGVGGEPARLLWMAPGRREAGVTALVIDRSAFLAGSALFLVGGALASLRIALPRTAKVAIVSLAALAMALVLALLALQRRGGVATPVARLLGLVLRRRRAALLEHAAAIDAQVRALHLARPERLAAAVALHLVGRLLGALEVLAGARLLGMGVGLEGAYVLAAVPVVVDLVFSMVPSQIGIYEGTNALLASALGVDPAAGVALAFLQRLRQLVFVTLGFALLALGRPRRFAADGAEATA